LVRVKDFESDVPQAGATSATRFKIDAAVYNFLGGVQVKDNVGNGSRFRPFGHALIGIARQRANLDTSFFSSAFCQQAGVDCRQGFSNSKTGFSAAVGDGFDMKASNRFGIRAFRVDYKLNRLGGSTQHNFRLGIVFH
jgi:hypothetical protein